MTDKVRKAHGEFCKAMTKWHKSFGEEWVEERRREAADRNGVDYHEFKEWQYR